MYLLNNKQVISASKTFKKFFESVYVYTEKVDTIETNLILYARNELLAMKFEIKLQIENKYDIPPDGFYYTSDLTLKEEGVVPENIYPSTLISQEVYLASDLKETIKMVSCNKEYQFTLNSTELACISSNDVHKRIGILPSTNELSATTTVFSYEFNKAYNTLFNNFLNTKKTVRVFYHEDYIMVQNGEIKAYFYQQRAKYEPEGFTVNCYYVSTNGAEVDSQDITNILEFLKKIECKDDLTPIRLSIQKDYLDVSYTDIDGNKDSVSIFHGSSIYPNSLVYVEKTELYNALRSFTDESAVTIGVRKQELSIGSALKEIHILLMEKVSDI